MDNENTFLSELMEHEGYRRDPYKDTKGLLTGGVGHLITDKDRKEFDPNWSDDQKDSYWAEKFKEDVDEATLDVIRMTSGWKVPPNEKQMEVLIDMRFNLGPNRLRKFNNFLKALSSGDTDTAADEMIDSKWHRDFVTWNSGKDTSNIRSRKLEKKMRGSKDK